MRSVSFGDPELKHLLMATAHREAVERFDQITPAFFLDDRQSLEHGLFQWYSDRAMLKNPACVVGQQAAPDSHGDEIDHRQGILQFIENVNLCFGATEHLFYSPEGFRIHGT